MEHKYELHRPWSIHSEAIIEDYAMSEASYNWSEMKDNWSLTDRIFGCLHLNKEIVEVKEKLYQDALNNLRKFISDKGVALAYSGMEMDYLVIDTKTDEEAEYKLSDLKKDFSEHYHTPLFVN